MKQAQEEREARIKAMEDRIRAEIASKRKENDQNITSNAEDEGNGGHDEINTVNHQQVEQTSTHSLLQEIDQNLQGGLERDQEQPDSGHDSDLSKLGSFAIEMPISGSIFCNLLQTCLLCILCNSIPRLCLFDIHLQHNTWTKHASRKCRASSKVDNQ